jgi:phosphoglycerate dehydrogenase-like enzyme
MLAVARRLVELDKVGRSLTWTRPLGVDVWQKTLGIVGLGRIGQGVAQRAYGFEMKVIAYEPYPNRRFCEKWNVELVDDVNDVFRRADFVTIHAPGEGGNQHLVNRERLSLMKPSAYLINTARGVLVNEDDLYEALTSGKIAGAGLDVRDKEPPEDERFSALRNVVLTPHISGSTEEAQEASAQMVVEQVLAAGRGEKPHALLNPDAWGKRRT